MTNYEKIKAMSIDEMAKRDLDFFGCPYSSPYDCCKIDKKFDGDCTACTKHWLESEAEE